MNGARSSVSVVWLFAILGLGLILSIALSVAASSFFYPLIPSRIDIKHGEALFQQRCAACHSVSSDKNGGMGPNLSTIGQVAGSRVNGQTAEQYILDSILDPDSYRAKGSNDHMPRGTVAGLDRGSVRNIIGYLAGMGGSIDEAKILDLNIEIDIVGKEQFIGNLDQIKYGWNLFTNKLGCSSCHSYLELPGDKLRAPSLAQSGQYSDDHILNSIRTPSLTIGSQWRTADIELDNGSKLRGRVVERTDDGIRLLTRSKLGKKLLELLEIKNSEIKELRFSDTSTMPPYTLTIRDEQALLAFLRSLNTSL